MARTVVVNIDANTSEAVNNIAGLESAIERLMNELETTDIGSAEFQRLSSEIAMATSELRNLELGFEGLDREQRITATTDTLAGLAGATTAAVGTFAALGIETEVLDNIQQRVIGLIGISTGIADAGRGLVAFNRL